jgi:cephalosporin-C deacetylase-like acetyl esterase
MLGNTNPWREFGHSSMYNSLARLEDPNSEEFKTTVREENAHWKTSLVPFQFKIQQWETLFQTSYQESIPLLPEYAHECIGDTIRIQHSQGHRMNVWCFQNGRIEHQYGGLTDFGKDFTSDLFFTIRDIGNGAETLELCVYAGDHTLLWKTSPVGPDAAFQKDRIFYQTVENQLRYPGIVSVAKQTGADPILVFEEPDKRFQVTLHQPPYQSDVFVRIQNALSQRIGILTSNRVHWMTSHIPNHANGSGESLFPIANDTWGTNTDIVIHNVKYPLLPNEFLVDAFQTDNTILYTTIHMASMSLYALHLPHKTVERLFGKDFPCEIKLRKQATVPTIEIGFPHKASKMFHYVQHTLKHVLTFPEPVSLTFRHGFAKSKDGTKVPYTLVWNAKKKKPKHLFVEGYGSYGMSSRRSYPIMRLAWLQKGYACAVSFARGGREDGDRWYDGGRTPLRKQNTFDDTAAVIQTIQDKYLFSQTRTIFYGRSAGGLLAANIAHQYPHLVGAVYAEVGYLDVLRTTSNPNLPLTQMEYDEFGDPLRRPDEFRALQKFSPVDTVPLHTKQSPIIVVKTALLDSQVLPYETLKWAKKLRANGWTVYVGIDKGGHFVSNSSLYRSVAEDAVILTSQSLSTSPSSATRKRHSSKGTRRRRTSSAKHVTKH